MRTLDRPDVVIEGEAATTSEPAPETPRASRALTLIAIFAMIIGAGSMLGGIAGAVYTWDQAADQGVVTPDDAAIAGADVRGPLTMWAQSDIITHHQLDNTDGLYYAEMDRMVPLVDEAGEVVVEDGEVVMVANEARASWITVTALTTALGLGILAYGVAALAVVVGLTLLALGWAVLRLNRQVALA